VKFHEAPLAGAYILVPERVADNRGSFARTFCAREFEVHGLITRLAQCSESRNTETGTLRGLHYQASPYAEAKTVRCIAGSAYDVIVDLRHGSPTRWRWFSLKLDARAGTALYVPPGFAHGFMTLEPETTLEYWISEFYVPEAARGVRFDDPTLDIKWPLIPSVVSERDRNLPFVSGLEDV
jgi:dTDP-4-dehydrorhamnose 3,5-epimerase